MGTLSKSFASCGGFVAGSSEAIRYLRVMPSSGTKKALIQECRRRGVDDR